MSTFKTTTIAETDWRFVESDGDPIYPGYVLTREVPDIAAFSVDDLWLAQQAVKTVESPKATGQTYAGSFVVSRINGREDAQRTGTIRQTLTKTATSLTAATAVARNVTGLTLVAGTVKQDILKLDRDWRFINPANVAAVVAALLADSDFVEASAQTDRLMTNPVIEGQTYTGEFVQGNIRTERQDNGTFTVVEPLTQVLPLGLTGSSNSAAVKDALIALAPAIQHGRAVQNELVFAVWSFTERTITLGFRFLTPQLQKLCMSVLTNADALAVLTGAGASWGAYNSETWTLAGREWRQEEDNSRTLLLKFNSAVGQSYAEANLKQAGKSSAYSTSTDQTATGTAGRIRLLLRGVAMSDVVATVSGYTTALANHVIEDVSMAETGEFGEGALQVALSRSFPHKSGSTVTTPDMREHQPQVFRTEGAASVVWTRVPGANAVDVFAAALNIDNYTTSNWAKLTYDYKTLLYAVSGVTKVDNGDNTYTIIGNLRLPLVAWDVTSLQNDWEEIRDEIEKSSTKPVAGFSGTLPDPPQDGFWWRMIRTYVSCKLTHSKSTAKSFADAGLSGSFNRRLGNREYYAERVDSRTVGDWKGVTMQGAVGFAAAAP